MLDDVEVTDVKIYNGPTFVGDAVFVEGARPDVEAAYPNHPLNYRAGWGYMMLTNFLPNNGNGTYTFYAKATDKEGNQVVLGSKTVYLDNNNAVKPFGAIDTPAQGGAASGNSFINWGWVLTPQPNSIAIDGSTINVYVDGVKLGHPVYNIYRSDIAGLFPGYANTNGAVGYFYLDTTGYSNGVHSIQWTAADSAGNTDGIGSRYFIIQNTSSDQQFRKNGMAPLRQRPIPGIAVNYSEPISVIKGYNGNIEPHTIYPGDNGITNIEIKELQLVKISLGNATGVYDGYLKVGNHLRNLPIGSTLDKEKGIFYWHPGPAFIGDYEFSFLQSRRRLIEKKIVIHIVPYNSIR